MPKQSKKSKKVIKRVEWKLVFSLSALFLISVFVFNRYYLLHKLQASVTGSESIEETQKYVPLDVQHEVEKQKKLYSLTEIKTVRVPILMYHYVEYVKDPNDKTRIGLSTTPLTLEVQIKTLKEAGYNFLTAGELFDILKQTQPLPEKPIVLTFDDGHKDFYTDAYPILKKYNVPATQYVISGYMNHPLHLSPLEVKTIADDGLVEIGAHTVDHDWLKDDYDEHVKYETEKSKNDLEKLTGKKIVSFAYPFGAFDQQAINIVQNVGYDTAVSTVPGINQSILNRYFLYRLRPGKRVGEELLNWLNQSNFTAF